jgi:hypothetical protein
VNKPYKINPITLKGQPDRRITRTGPRPERWAMQDPETRTLYYKFLRARVQARYWCQEWQLSWPEYREFFRSVPWQNTNRRASASLNLCRINKAGVWSVKNCAIMTRQAAMSRPKTLREDGKVLRRRRANPKLGDAV